MAYRRAGDTDLRGEKIIDSRDLIARFESLKDDREALESAIEEAKETLADFNDDTSVIDEDEKEEQEDLVKERQQELTDWDEENGDEYKALKDLIEEAEGYGDFKHGEALIRDDYFTEYAEQLADDLGAIDRNASWPISCIDWEKAADELKADYSSFEFDGVTYWMRS
jgi:hypothetical protein